jgi:RNA polymerase sigma factor (sigma-70 family)
MNEVIKLVKTYRVTAGAANRLLLAEEIFRLIELDLRLFVFSAIRRPAAEDVLQEILKAVATGMGKFKGGSNEEFWGWCYRIARNKMNDHFRMKATDREQPIPQDELWQLVEASGGSSSLSVEDRIDLEYAMKLLIASKPECYDYLWKRFVFGLEFTEIAEEQHLSYDAARMKVGRCLDEAQTLMA